MTLSRFVEAARPGARGRGRLRAVVKKLPCAVSSLQTAVDLGLNDAMLFGTAEGDVQLDEMETTLPALVDAGATIVLTGKASTSQRQ